MTATALTHPRWTRAEAYIAAAQDGSQPLGILAQAAIQRHQDDLERAASDDSFPYFFSPDHAEYLLASMESLPHVEGGMRGKPLILDPWQSFIFGALNGWRCKAFNRERNDYLRRFLTAYIEVPRKNGKSTSLAALGLHFLTVDDEPGAKVFSAASTLDQARIVFEIARGMALDSEWPDAFGLDVQNHRILTHDPMAHFKPIASQTKSKDGKNPHLAIVDELHEHPDAEVWDSLDTALGSRDHPLLIAITTAGSNIGGICYEERTRVEGILTGAEENDRYFGIIFCADQGDDPGDERTWKKANPALGSGKSLDYMRDQWTKAKNNPRALGEFLRKHLCIWTSIGAGAFDLQGWEAGMAHDLDWRTVDCDWRAVSVDMSIRDDLTAIVAVGQKDSRAYARGRYFATGASIDKYPDIKTYVARGLIERCGEVRIDNMAVEDAIVAMVRETGVKIVAFDPWGASGVIQHVKAKLAAAGMEDVAVIEVRHRPMDFTQPLQRLQSFVEDGALVTDGDAALHWMAGNTLEISRGDFTHIARRDETKKIDGIAALVAAFTFIEADLPAPETTSYLSDGALISV